MASGTAAPPIEKEPSSENANSAASAMMRSPAFGAKSFRFTAIGIKIRLIARIIAVLHITEPMPLPIAIPTLSCDAATQSKAPEARTPCPSIAAMVDTIISGSVVATLIIVAPIMNFGIL